MVLVICAGPIKKRETSIQPGYMFCGKVPHKDLTVDMCLPTMELVKKEVDQLVRKYDARSIFIATDFQVEKLQHILREYFESKEKNIDIHFIPKEIAYRAQVDLAILEKADVLIGSCASSYTSYAIRSRSIQSLPSYFWGTNLAIAPSIATSYDYCNL